MTTHQIVTVAGCMFVPMLSLYAADTVRKWRMSSRGETVPVSEKLLRPPGESLRLKIEELNDELTLRLGLAIIVPGVVLALMLSSRPGNGVSPGSAFVVCAILVNAFAWWAYRIVKDLRACRLGLHGERAVGEELNQLMLKGCRVFHDVPMEPYGNIDHVVVSPSGVFAVETKMRWKRPAPKGRKKNEAIFDGKGVEFPTWRETKMVDQARAQANHLRQFLTEAIGEPVAVQAVLTLPGWYVTSRVPMAAVRVLNPCLIDHLVTDSKSATLADKTIRQIAHQLNQKCRTVEL